MLEPLGILLLAGVLLAGCYVVFRVTSPDGFGRELLSATIGAVVTLAVAGLVALVALWDRIQRRRERATIRRMSRESWPTTAIRAGLMTVEGMCVVASCTQGVPWTQRVTFECVPGSPRPKDDLVESHRQEWLTQLERSKGKDYVLNDGPRVDLVGADLELRSHAGRTRPHYTFQVAPSTYYDFACANVRLDEPFTHEGDEPLSLRERWGTYPLSIQDVGNLRAPAPIGSGTVVVTSDDRLVLGIRHRTFVASADPTGTGRHPVHFVAEGLLPTDTENGRLSPRAGAFRGLREELHIGNRSDHIAKVTRLIDTGLSFDQSRWQPYFTYLAYVDASWDELQTGAAVATDAWEVETLVSLPFDIEHAGVRLLLQGRHPDLHLASNHAGAALWFALVYKHGYHQLRDELTTPSAAPNL